jgi:hypothetical protein
MELRRSETLVQAELAAFSGAQIAQPYSLGIHPSSETA